MFRIRDKVFTNYQEVYNNFPSSQDMYVNLVFDRNEDNQLSCSYFDNKDKLAFWEDIVNYYCSKEFFREVCENFGLDYKNKKLLQRKDPRMTKDDVGYDFIFVVDTVKMSMKGMDSHLDNSNKISQTMIYFRDPDDLCDDRNIVLDAFDYKIDYIANREFTMMGIPNNYHHVTPGNSCFERKMAVAIFQLGNQEC